MVTLLFSCLQVYQWYSPSHITGGGTGTIAKIMVSATDDVLEKYIYKDTLARNLAAIIYRATSVVF
jgi:thimet oligopeptidase